MQRGRRSHRAAAATAGAAALLTLAAAAAYRGSLGGAWVYDDPVAIAGNPTIRHLGSALFPPGGGLPVSGRPVVNLSFALNYAWGGIAVRGYHAVNLVIHVLAGLTLFGIARRTLARTTVAGGATAIAFVVALWWIADPLQSESVAYLSQRAESLMGLFYLLTLYCLIRGSGGSPLSAPKAASRRFYWLSVVCCLLGMATKEVMATAPLIVVLYDRTFLAGSLRAAWRLRRGYYLALASTWLVFAALVIANLGRGRTAGFGSGVPWWAYAETQFWAVAHYLRLCLWPAPLVFDYGLIIGGSRLALLGDAVLIGGLLVATAILLRRRSPLGFLGAWFFLILAPSSSVVPIASEIVAEHRLYLPLAAALALLVHGVYAAALRSSGSARKAQIAVLAGGCAVGAVLVAATAVRVRAYATPVALWSDTVAKLPDNERAHNNLGTAWAEIPGHWNDAIAEYQAALRLNPRNSEEHDNLGRALSEVPGRLGEAIGQYFEALRLNPRNERAHLNLGNAWLESPGRLNDSIFEYQEAIRLAPNDPAARTNLALAQSRRD